MLRTLGTNVQEVTVDSEQYVIRYGDGDECFYNPNKTFTSEIRFVCDHDEEEGWPRQLVRKNDSNAEPCHIVFEWKSKYACRHCLNHEVTNVEGPCTWDYRREVTQTPAKSCMIYSAPFISLLSSH